MNSIDPSGFACTPTSYGDCDNAPGTSPVVLCSVGGACLPTTPNEAPAQASQVVQLGTVQVGSQVTIPATNVSADAPDASAQPVSGGGSGSGSAPPPGQISPISTKPFECLSGLSCGASNGVIDRINSTDGGAVWDGVCFGCGWESTPSYDPEMRNDPGRGFDASEAARRAALQRLNQLHSVGGITGPSGIANSEIGTGLALGENFFVTNGSWRGSNGQLYSLGKYFGNQYGRTAAETAKIADGLKVAGKVSVFAGVAIGGIQWYGDVSKGNTAMAVRDSTDIGMGGVALAFPFGTGYAAMYFTGELLHDIGGFDAYGSNVSQNIAIQGPGYNSGPKY